MVHYAKHFIWIINTLIGANIQCGLTAGEVLLTKFASLQCYNNSWLAGRCSHYLIVLIFFFFFLISYRWKQCLSGGYSYFLYWVWQCSSTGLLSKASLEFINYSRFPQANTCENILRIPVHADYTAFKSDMDFAIRNSPGFGRAWVVRGVLEIELWWGFFFSFFVCH